MCIRDSYFASFTQASPIQKAKETKNRDYGNAAPATGPYMICLLYTSDAADERSSVDLGGRRIIKKKTTIDQNRLPY